MGCLLLQQCTLLTSGETQTSCCADTNWWAAIKMSTRSFRRHSRQRFHSWDLQRALPCAMLATAKQFNFQTRTVWSVQWSRQTFAALVHLGLFRSQPRTSEGSSLMCGAPRWAIRSQSASMHRAHSRDNMHATHNTAVTCSRHVAASRRSRAEDVQLHCRHSKCDPSA